MSHTHQNVHSAPEEEAAEDADEAGASPISGQTTPEDTGPATENEDSESRHLHSDEHSLGPERDMHARPLHPAMTGTTAVHSRAPEADRQHSGAAASASGQLHMDLRGLALEDQPNVGTPAQAPISQADKAGARQPRSMHKHAAVRPSHRNPSVSSAAKRKQNLTFSAPPFAHKACTLA